MKRLTALLLFTVLLTCTVFLSSCKRNEAEDYAAALLDRCIACEADAVAGTDQSGFDLRIPGFGHITMQISKHQYTPFRLQSKCADVTAEIGTDHCILP